MPHTRGTTTIAILGGNPVADNVLSLLLRGEGYDTRVLQEESPTALAEGPLEGVDVLLLTSGLSNAAREDLLSVVRGNPNTAQMPILILGANAGEVPDDEGCVPVAWPTRIGELVQEIEAVLAPATNEEGQGPL